MSPRTFLALSALAALFSTTVLAQAPDLSKLDLVERSVPDGPIATIDGRSIPRESFLYLYATEVGTLAALKKGEKISDSDRISTAIVCVTELVQREILVSEAEKRGIKISDTEIEEAYKKELNTLIERYAKEGKKVTEAEVLKDGGRTREEALGEMRKALTIERVRADIVKDKAVTVSDAEIQAFYDENKSRFMKSGGVHLKQIFVRPKPDAQSANEQSWKEAQSRIEKAIARIQAGENFDAVAKAVSEAPNAKDGGDLGTAPVEELPPFYRDAVPSLKPGELSPIIKSEYGLHMIQLVSISDEQSANFDQVKDRIRKLLLQGKAEGVVDDFCRPIYDNVDRVKIFLSLERAIQSIPQSERPQAPSGNAAAKPAAKSAPKAEAAKPAAKPEAEGKKSDKKADKKDKKKS